MNVKWNVDDRQVGAGGEIGTYKAGYVVPVMKRWVDERNQTVCGLTQIFVYKSDSALSAHIEVIALFKS
ncbi:hypothetical protein INT43_001095 [Umbelopsis isabellina]|uniref:Uncharacterized protein n=1 Tax=Mortierella isabellina TaxID=91625 RepID=A0A8H7UD20_MORIS|nr:hypothetical protein INT43_001095 [Umbelopsis isabellina]